MITGDITMLFEQALVVCATVCVSVYARVFVCICVYFDTRIHTLYILFISFCIAFNKFLHVFLVIIALIVYNINAVTLVTCDCTCIGMHIIMRYTILLIDVLCLFYQTLCVLSDLNVCVKQTKL